MSVEFNRKLGEAGGDCWTLMNTDERSKNGWRSQSLVWWIGAVAVCLGFLLLIVILGLVAQNSKAISHGDKKLENLIQVGNMKYENLIYNLTKDRDVLRHDRDQLRINASALEKEMEVLQNQYNAMVASRDKLQEEVNRLNQSSNGTEKTCNPGWRKFNNKCYYFSNGVSKTWEDSRKFCKDTGANLAIITTEDELDFVIRRNGIIWIGLSDKEQEGQWKWVDGTDLLGRGFWQDGEPNNTGNEDCVEASEVARAWNDAPCSRKFSWVCED